MTAGLVASLVRISAQSGPSTPGQILDWIEFRVGAWAGTIQQAMVAWAIQALAVVIALAFVWYGYRVLFAVGGAGTLSDIAAKFGRIVVVIVFTMASIVWWPALYTFFTRVPKELSELVLAATGAGTGAVALLDSVFERGIATGFQVIQNAGYLSAAGWIVGILIIIGTFLFVGLMFAQIGMASIIIALLLGLAPLMVLALPFEMTKSIFEKWLGLLINYALLPILVYTIGTLLAVGAQDALILNGQEPSLEAVIPYLTWCALGFGVLIQAPSVSASLGGGLVMSGAAALAASGVVLTKRVVGGAVSGGAGAGASVAKRLKERTKGDGE